MTPGRWLKLALAVCLSVTPVLIGATTDNLSSAYRAVLRGDYEAGRTTLAKLMTSDATGQARQVHGWLDDYHGLVASRNELKAKTFDWCVEQARAALDKKEAFLALGFSAQAAPYAADLGEFGQEEWVRGLTERIRATAREYAEADNWSRALNCYVMLERIYPKDTALRDLREEAARHARLEVVYKDEKALQERTRGVDRDLLRHAIRQINGYYWQEPDFRKATLAGIDNLSTVATSHKLQKYLDGLANPAARTQFMDNLRELRKEVEKSEKLEYQDVIRVFNRVADASKLSVELPVGLLVVEFLEGLDPALDDYTSVVWPADARDFDKMMMGGFEGVGIQLGLDEHTNRLKVVTPLEDSPALEAGVEPDDLIVAVNGNSTKGWTTDDAVRNIMGASGSEVVMTVLRPRTGEQLVFKLVRRNIVLTSVRGLDRDPANPNAWNYMLDKSAGVAYIRLTNFLPESHRELSRALSAAREQGMQGLILDVRHNPGGLLDVAVEIVSLFLDSGEVVSTRGRLESEVRERVVGRATYKDLPLVVLVNEASASASEILAGALQDHGRAIIVGERTFGKGSVQHIRPLASEARLKLTTALYYLPSGRSPHKLPGAEKWGVDPDWEVKLTPKEFRRVLEHERESYVIHNEKPTDGSKELSAEEREKVLAALKSEDKEDEEDQPPMLSEADIKLLESDPNEAEKTDPQLQTALLLIRVKLAANLPWPRELAAAPESDVKR